MMSHARKDERNNGTMLSSSVPTQLNVTKNFNKRKGPLQVSSSVRQANEERLCAEKQQFLENWKGRQCAESGCKAVNCEKHLAHHLKQHICAKAHLRKLHQSMINRQPAAEKAALRIISKLHKDAVAGTPTAPAADDPQKPKKLKRVYSCDACPRTFPYFSKLQQHLNATIPQRYELCTLRCTIQKEKYREQTVPFLQ